MIDYQLTDGDIVIRNGDIVTITEPQATAQRLEQKLLLWRGEWFLDVNAGFPWLQDILGRRPSPQVVRSLIFDLVQSDPEVRAVESLTIETADERGLRIEFTARLQNGQPQTVEVTL